MTPGVTDAFADDHAGAAEAARALVAAFSAHDREGYFAAFAPDATFVFHTNASVLRSRAEYEAEWRSMEADGFHVDRCETSETDLRPIGPGVALLTHRVATWLAGADEPLDERETIVFRRQDDGRWLAVHEHLSPQPQA